MLAAERHAVHGFKMRRLGAVCGSAYDVIEADAAEVEELAIAAWRAARPGPHLRADVHGGGTAIRS
jgi:hypothetical protein